MRIRIWAYRTAALGLLLFGTSVRAIDSETAPRPVPLTRPEMKQFLEDMKARKPRIPLPELTDDDREKLGERGLNYESRLRYHYLPQGSGGAGGGRGAGGAGGTGSAPGAGGGGGSGFGFAGGGGRDTDSDLTLDYAFKTELFWIVSRTNNCQYCLGHQESKLLSAGLTEDQIAALDGDWSKHSPKEQTAFAFARKVTYEPHRLNNADIEGLRAHFTDKQILEMLLSVCGNNSINRWKEGAGIPQSTNGGNFGARRPGEAGAAAKDAAAAPPAKDSAKETAHSYLTPTSAQFESVITKVAPISVDPKSGKAEGRTVFRRPPLESWDEVEKALQLARTRTPRLPLTDEAATRAFLPDDFPSGSTPQWARLVANFPNSAKSRITSIENSEKRGELSPLLKAQASWIIARQDRAWYALSQAYQRLRQLGQTDAQIQQLDGDWQVLPPRERSLFVVAQKLAASPVVLTDADVEQAVKHAGPRDVVQLISYTTHRASFDRMTEAAGLQAEK